jgi:hypothetical protein
MRLERGDNVSVSEVVIKSTENGPDLVVVDGKVVQALCRCGGSTPHALLRRNTQEKWIHSKNTRSQTGIMSTDAGVNG